MIETLTRESLIAFEEEIRESFERGEIKAPVHFSGGNEDILISIFSEVHPEDWVFSTHRSHYHALLKGIDREWLKSEILEGRSISVNNREHRFFTSAIVAGAVPIAVGVALGIEGSGSGEHVWVFVGDMAAETGIFHEALKFSRCNGLPISFVVEDNGFSVNTLTQMCWGTRKAYGKMQRYSYERRYPHQGSGKWIDF